MIDFAGSRRLLALTASTVALVMSGQALAQTAPTPEPQTAPAAPTATDTADEPEVNDVIVTGSRIARPEIDSPTPVTSYTSANLQQSGRVNVTDFLSQNPALLGSSTSAQQSGSTSDFGATGVNLLNLRNLGTDRTLVLVDGRRHVAGLPGTASVDINTIPADLIDRIDVTTGGA